MNFITRLKIAWLLLRVIKLQAKAPQGVTYNFEYTGCTNEVDFIKFRKVNGTYVGSKRLYCYLDKDYGCTLSEVEEQITEEKEKLKNA